MDKVVKPVEKQFFLNNIAFFLSVRGKVLNNFRNELFPIKYLDKIQHPKLELDLELELKLEPELELELEPEPKPESKPVPILKHRKHSLKSLEEFLNEFTHAEKNINKEIFN